MSLLRRIEKSLDQRLRSVFGASKDEAGGREAIELYRDALDRIGARASVGKRGERIFPFDLIRIELRAENAERKAVLESLFDAGQLVEDIRATLAEERVTLPANLTVAVHYPGEAESEMTVVCEKSDRSKPAVEAVKPFIPARLTTVLGASNAHEFAVDKPHVNIGRESEVVDALGRTVRRNDLFFPDGTHEANASISRSHAHIQFDRASGEWRIFDDGSTFGTSLFRAGKRIEVPAHSARGVLLRDGDEIYLGQVRLGFGFSVSA